MPHTIEEFVDLPAPPNRKTVKSNDGAVKYSYYDEDSNVEAGWTRRFRNAVGTGVKFELTFDATNGVHINGIFHDLLTGSTRITRRRRDKKKSKSSKGKKKAKASTKKTKATKKKTKAKKAAKKSTKSNRPKKPVKKKSTNKKAVTKKAIKKKSTKKAVKKKMTKKRAR